jgi:hypothetical protein
VQEAQATALVIKAKAEAEQIRLQATASGETPTVASTHFAVVKTDDQLAPITTEAAAQETQPPEAQRVEIVRVGFAAEGGFIVIQFRAPPDVAEGWWQGDILLVDESTETEYEVPEMPSSAH